VRHTPRTRVHTGGRTRYPRACVAR